MFENSARRRISQGAFLSVAALLLGSSLLAAAPAHADSGQLRDPTRCGQGGANCRNLPPSGPDRLKGQQQPRRDLTPSKLPSRSTTSPLPSEGLRRNPLAPSSTGLDKGSTGLTPPPIRKHIGH